MADRIPNNDECKICKYYYGYQSLCDDCLYWYHPKCVGLKVQDVKAMGDQDWFCPDCIEKRRNRVTQSENLSQTESNNLSDGSDSPGIDNNSDEPATVETTSQENTPNDEEEPRPGPSNTNSRPLRDITINSSQATEEDDDGEVDDTDDEGYGEIDKILKYKTQASGRKFLVSFKQTRKQPRKEKWISEDDCDGCVTLLKKFCKDEGIEMTKIRYKPGFGSADPKTVNKKNFATLEEALRMVRIYGRKDVIQPQPFTKLNDNDGLYLLQVGEHCFTILHYAQDKMLYIADGENLILRSRSTQDLVDIELDNEEIVVRRVKVNGQKEKNQCASSAAAIAIEFQRVYVSKEVPREITIGGQRKERIASVLHKEVDQKIQRWKPVLEHNWMVECSSCGTRLRTKNKGSLNLHRC